jgi:uncharacterized protein YjbI with pentapeptide repeats
MKFMNRIDNQTIENETIKLKDDTINCLGPNLTLKNCEIILCKTSKSLIASRVIFENCRIVGKKTRKALWFGAKFVGCTFSGHFVENEFGNRHDITEIHGLVEDCNFELASLQDCRFYDTNMNTLILPKYPEFSIIYPIDFVLLEKINWIGKTVRLFEYLKDQRETISGISANANEMAKLYEVDVEVLRKILLELGDNVFM